MGLFDFLKPKSQPHLILGVMVTLEVEESQVLFILLSQDGSINRLGNGSEKNTEKDLFIGKTNPQVFQEVSRLAPPIINEWVGGFADPAPTGKICTLTVGFQMADGTEKMSIWKYGTESQGPHPLIGEFVVKAVQATNPWFEIQREMVAKS